MQQLALPPEPPEDPFRLLAVHPTGAAVAVASLLGSVFLAVRRPPVPPSSPSSLGSVMPGAGSSTAGPFGSPVALKLAHNLWSLVFADASTAEPAATAAAAAAAASSGAAAQHISLVALHQHPLSGAFAVAEYSCPATAALGSVGRLGSAALQLTAFQPLADAGGSSGGGSSSPPDSPVSRSGGGSLQLGQPRALVQLPPAAEGWHPGARLLLRESGVQLISSSTPLAPEPAAQAAERWWKQQEPQATKEAAAGMAAAEAAAEQAAGPQPMAVSLERQPSLGRELFRPRRQASLEQLLDAYKEEVSQQEEDVEMSEAEEMGPAVAPAEPAGEAAASRSPSARSASAVAGKAADAAPAASSSRQLVTCCCWEWQEPAEGQPVQQQPALVCALEDGSLWRLPLPSAAECGSSGSCLLPCPDPAASTAPAARSLAALPGGLLCACTDCSGLQLLRLGPSCAYEPLLLPLASGQQGAAGWDSSAAAAACCTLPAAATVADCMVADLEGGGQAQVYAACCGMAGSGGRLCVLYPDPKPETVFELPGAAEVR